MTSSTPETFDRVTMFGAEWCRDCRRSKALLDRLGAEYDYVDLEAVADGATRPRDQRSHEHPGHRLPRRFASGRAV